VDMHSPNGTVAWRCPLLRKEIDWLRGTVTSASVVQKDGLVYAIFAIKDTVRCFFHSSDIYQLSQVVSLSIVQEKHSRWAGVGNGWNQLLLNAPGARAVSERRPLVPI
jgi:hypothetical protein